MAIQTTHAKWQYRDVNSDVVQFKPLRKKRQSTLIAGQHISQDFSWT